MAEKILTLSKKDKNFMPVLMGEFSKHERALPQQSFRVGSDEEWVSFLIKPKNEMIRPSVWMRIFFLLRIDHLLFLLIPLVTVAHLLANKPQPLDFLLVSLTLIFLHFTLSLGSEAADHLSGFDRFDPLSGSQVIQKGWYSAQELIQLSRLFMILSLISGLLFLSQKDLSIWYLSLASVLPLAFIGMNLKWVKSHFIFEFLAFLLSGPLLVFPLFLALHPMANPWPASSPLALTALSLFSIFWGLWVYLILLVKRWLRFMFYQETKKNSWFVRLGFDGAKIPIYFFAGLAFLCFLGFLVTAGLSIRESGLIKILCMSFLGLSFMGFFVYFLKLLQSAQSNMGSKNAMIKKNLLYAHRLLCLFLFFIWL